MSQDRWNYEIGPPLAGENGSAYSEAFSLESPMSGESFRQRQYGLHMLLSYLVENNVISLKLGNDLVERFDDGDEAVHAALWRFDRSEDATALMRRLQSI